MENPITAIVFIAILGLLAYFGRDRGESEVTHENIAENEVPAMKKTRADEFEKTIIEYLEANDIEVTAENVAYFKEKLNRRLNFKRR